MLSPLLALPFVARVAEAYSVSISFSCNQQIIICQSDGILIKGTPPLLSTFSFEHNAIVECRVVEVASNNSHFPSPQSREIEAKALIILEKFAHKTYAPATEESRLRGAG